MLTLIGIVFLHAAWDASTGWAIMTTKGVVEGDWLLAWPNTEDWIGSPTDQMLVVWQITYDGLLILNSLIGVSWLVHEWRRHPNAEEPTPA